MTLGKKLFLAKENIKRGTQLRATLPEARGVNALVLKEDLSYTL